MEKYFILMVLCLAILLNPSFATDHGDSPTIKDFPEADITDLFAFPQKTGNKNTLVLSMTTHLFAKKKSKFSDKVEYSFHLRRAYIDGFGKSFNINTEAEYKISCFFTNDEKGQTVRCVVQQVKSFGNVELITVTNKVGDLSGGPNKDFRLFAGLRADPFFFDVVRINQERKRKTSYDDTGFPFPGIIPKNVLAYGEVLAITVELDIDKILGKGNNSLFAVAAHTQMTSEENGKKVTKYIDRMGRPEITNFIMGQMSITDEKLNRIKFQWNGEANTFALNSGKTKLYRDAIAKGINNLDSKDDDSSKTRDWTSSDSDMLVNILVNDFLLVDISKTASVDTVSYFEIEKARMKNQLHKTCGGRTPNDDIVDHILTLLINGPDRKTPNRGDGIDSQRRPATNKFPYLGAP